MFGWGSPASQSSSPRPSEAGRAASSGIADFFQSIESDTVRRSRHETDQDELEILVSELFGRIMQRSW